MSIEDTDLRAV